MIIHEAVISYQKREIEEITLDDAEKTYNYLYKWMAQNISDPTREYFIICGMNIKFKMVFTKILTVGHDSSCLVKPSDVLKQILLNNCNTYVCAHNHPSGEPAPSNADIRVTRMLREASQILDMNFMDHIILGEVSNDPNGLGYYSFREAGLI